MKITPPQFELKAFNCPLCKAYSHMSWKNEFFYSNDCIVHAAICTNCIKSSLWRTQLNSHGAMVSTTMIFPDNTISVIAELDMPENVKNDFDEAKSVFNKSPRAAAALLRLALQKLLKHLGEPGNNINTDIKSLISKSILSQGVQRAADTIRITGNNAVHPGTMNDEDIDFIAAKMFDLVNFIVRQTITEPKEIKALYEATPESAREAITKRDKSKE